MASPPDRAVGLGSLAARDCSQAPEVALSSLKSGFRQLLNRVFDVDAYFEREVRPHVPDAWMDRGKDKVGYEINFNRHFYKYTPPRSLEEIDAELKQAEQEMFGLDVRGAELAGLIAGEEHDPTGFFSEFFEHDTLIQGQGWPRDRDGSGVTP